MVCVCLDCINKPEVEREFSCTQFEQHAGAGAAKKWKASLRVEPGSSGEVSRGQAPPVTSDLMYIALRREENNRSCNGVALASLPLRNANIRGLRPAV